MDPSQDQDVSVLTVVASGLASSMPCSIPLAGKSGKGVKSNVMDKTTKSAKECLDKDVKAKKVTSAKSSKMANVESVKMTHSMRRV